MSAAGRPRRVLLVAYYYPPRPIIGARRPFALAKHLRAAGHEVTVLTTVLNGGEAATGELRARDLLATRLNWRREQSEGTGAPGADAAWTPGPGLWGSIFVPDVQLLSWVPFATARALRDAMRHRPDVVITTSPIESAHLVGLALQRLRGIPWVADLRDGWRFEAPRDEWPLAAQRRADDALERLIVRRADALVTVSEPLSADLRARHGVPVETITNGYDPDDGTPSSAGGAGRAAADASTGETGRLALVHTGGLGHERTLRPVLDALARLAADDPTLPERVELVVAGAQTEQERELYATHPAAPMVRPVGMLRRPEALELQRKAGLLLLVTSGVRTGEATGKLFEYLAAGPPVLVLGDDSAAASIVTGAGAGWAIPVRDADAAEARLRGILAGEQPPPGDGAGRESYGYPVLAARYADVLERAIEARAAR